MPYVIAALVALALFTAPRPKPKAPTDPPIAEIERDTAFAALQRLGINQQCILFVSGETVRRLNAMGALVGWFSTAVKGLTQ